MSQSPGSDVSSLVDLVYIRCLRVGPLVATGEPRCGPGITFPYACSAGFGPFIGDTMKLNFRCLPPDCRLTTIEVSDAEFQQWRIRTRGIRSRPHLTPLGETVYPYSIIRAGDTWLLRSRTTVDPRIVCDSPEEVDSWFITEAGSGRREFVTNLLPEPVAIQYLLADGHDLPDNVTPPTLAPDDGATPPRPRRRDLYSQWSRPPRLPAQSSRVGTMAGIPCGWLHRASPRIRRYGCS
jgi:hypothetical protein